MASDVDFGYDGKMYLSDYPTNPFDRTTSGGRIYTVFDKARIEQPIVVETRNLFREGFEHRNAKELITLLHHDDMRVRLRAQFALAARGSESASDLTTIANGDDNQLARLHAIWGLGQIGRSHPNVLSPVVTLLTDKDSEVRAQAARVLGDARYEPSAGQLVQLLTDESERVRFFAALALGSLKHKEAVEPIMAMLRENSGRDRQLAHAGVAALEMIGDRELVQRFAGDESMAVRMTVLLVQRRWADPRIVQFLDDAELKIVTEAARAINDLPLPAGREKLASLAERFRNASGDEVVPLLRRIVNANLQLGQQENVEAVIAIATSEKQPLVIRREAIAALAAWQGSTTRDRVTGFWQPIEARDGTVARDAVQQAAARLLATAPDALQADVTELLVTLKVETDDRVFASWVVDANRSSDVRIAALRLLNSRRFGDLSSIIDTLLASDNPNLRSEARDLLADHDADRTTSLISQLLNDQQADMGEKQRAFATLARMKSPGAGQALDDWAVRLRERQVPASLQLDLIEALTVAPTESRQAAVNDFKTSGDSSDPLAAWQVALNGGNAERGRDLFVGHAVAQCIRCHTVGGRGGMAGPDLSAVAHPERNVDRRYLLESMMLPNAKIAKGFGTVTLVLNTGKLVAGTIKDEDADSVTLLTPSNETIRIARDTIDDQSATTSAMPAMTRTLTLRELRDLVEYLSTLTTKSERQ
jgi:quinoprotein glucose dehydrogenase